MSTRPVLGIRGLLLVAASACTLGRAQVIPPGADLTDLTVEELGELTISAAAKRAEPVFQTPAAVAVVTSGEATRFGFDTVADALRLVPGVQVGQANAGYTWEVGIRGFDGIDSTKVLVLLDGRTIYSPFYGGVDWAEADMDLQDLDRIEVVRGPGATLWGPNAVNGVVNIVSKDARDTQGGYVSVREGTGEGAHGVVRYGGRLGNDAWYRVYVSEADTRAATNPSDSGGLTTGFIGVRTGFRADGAPSDTLHLTVQGEFDDLHYYHTLATASVSAPTAGDIHRPGDLLGRATWRNGDGDEMTLQLYADRNWDIGSPDAFATPGGSSSFGLVNDGRDYDVDFTDHLKLGSHDVVWGGGGRYTLVDLTGEGGSALSVPQSRQVEHLYNLFAQDELAVVPGLLKLTFGSKFEHDTFAGSQILPSLRLTATPSSDQTWWFAASRAIRTPSVAERDIRLTYAQLPATASSPAVRIDLVGTPGFHQEDLYAFELGWRARVGARFTVDVAAYYDDYSNVRDLAPSYGLELQPPTVVESLVATNGASARGYGAEASATWVLAENWRVSVDYTEERLVPSGLVLPEIFAPDFGLPHRMAGARTWVELPRDVRLSLAAYAVGRLDQREFGIPDVPGYLRVDAQAAWWPRTDLELDVGVQNAEGGHREVGEVSFDPSAVIPVNVYGQCQWRF